MKIGIIGGGYVGLHTAVRLTEINRDWKIKVIDIDEEKISKFNNGLSPIDDYYMKNFMEENPYKLNNIEYELPDNDWNKFNIIFIALSTNPSSKDESKLNTKLIFDLAKKIKEANKEISVVIRSTINMEDSKIIDELGLNYWPEFLSQGVETKLNINQNINVVHISSEDNFAIKLFDKLFYNKTLIKANIRESIMIKVMHNTLDAYLINITNLFANLSEENDIDFSIISPAVQNLLFSRPKVKKPGIGYGGSCYPKDSYSLINITDKDQNKKFIQEMDNFNKEQSYAFLYKEEVIRKAKNIVVLGSSFKGGTNDTTKTPTLSLRKWLIENNIEYKIWEPMIESKWIMDNESISTNIEEDINNSDLVIVASDWKEFNSLLLNYDKKVIDLKSFIKKNGKMNIHYLGNKNFIK